MRSVMLLPILIAAAGCSHMRAQPMSFRCGSLLTEHMAIYQGPAQLRVIQRDAGQDDLPDQKKSFGLMPIDPRDGDSADDPILQSLTREKSDLAPASAPATLMLSGGGSWGAFGAGFLQASSRRDWQIVTGISTGALQGLLVAAGDYDRLVIEYEIGAQEDLARTNGTLGIFLKGSQYDISPLRQRVLAYLLEGADGKRPFDRMAGENAPDLFVGMVEARTGDLKVIAISKMVRSVFNGSGVPEDAQVRELAECVAGVTLASSSIPVRLTAVQIDGVTYMDGGVRSSVFDAVVAHRLAFAADPGTRPNATPSDIFVVRNGPTVVFRDKNNESGTPEVDERPDAMRVGLRAYSTIVNQSELMSIASLRLIHPRGAINVMTADGFNSPDNPERCGPRPEEIFHPGFMKCLVKWGRYKAASYRWIDLSAVPARR